MIVDVDVSTQRSELATFLRARRLLIKPEAVGLQSGPRRRTAGLRREEVAERAEVGVTWYTWLEQGRDIRVSHATLLRIAEALQLSSSDSAYFFSLARRNMSTTDAPASEALDDAQTLLDGFTIGPAMLCNQRFDCVAFNRLADAVYEWSGSGDPLWQKFVWRTFMDPVRRAMYRDAENLVANGIGMLRARYANHVGDPHFESLIDALRQGSDEFRHLWNEQQTASLNPIAAELVHHRYGLLCIRSIRAVFPSIPEHTLLYVAPVDAATARVFANLQ